MCNHETNAHKRYRSLLVEIAADARTASSKLQRSTLADNTLPFRQLELRMSPQPKALCMHCGLEYGWMHNCVSSLKGRIAQLERCIEELEDQAVEVGIAHDMERDDDE